MFFISQVEDDASEALNSIIIIIINNNIIIVGVVAVEQKQRRLEFSCFSFFLLDSRNNWSVSVSQISHVPRLSCVCPGPPGAIRPCRETGDHLISSYNSRSRIRLLIVSRRTFTTWKQSTTTGHKVHTVTG